MKIKRFALGTYGVNCYIVSCSDTNKGFMIDPGGYSPQVIDYINKEEINIEFILMTHAHGDHICGLPQFMKELDAPVYLHEDEFDILNNVNLNFSNAICGNSIQIKADKTFKDCDVIELGELKIEIIHTPGHTPGGICIRVASVLFSGDTLFRDSIGRTDFPYSDTDQLLSGIKERLYVLDPNTVVYPGHGPESSIAYEKKSNMFVRG